MPPEREAQSGSTLFSLMSASAVSEFMRTSVHLVLTDTMNPKILQTDHLQLGNWAAKAENQTGRLESR